MDQLSAALDRLERIQCAAWSAALVGDLRSIEVVVKVTVSRAKLLGLDTGRS